MFQLKYVIFLCLLAISQFSTTNSARILSIIPVPSYSHQIFFRPLWKELANRGHELVVITSDPTNKNLPNIKEISVRDSYGPMKEMMNIMVNTSIFEIFLTSKWQDISNKMFTVQLEVQGIQDLIKNETEHFDLLIIEHYLSPLLAFKHRFNCPMIGVGSMDALPISHEVMGNPTHSVLYPAAMFSFQEDLSFLQRVVVAVFGKILEHLLHAQVEDMNEMARKHFGRDVPSVKDILVDTDMLFVNANPVLSAIRPHSPSTISIAGGMHLSEPKPLPKNMKDFLDSAKEGAIYFSLGTNVMSSELSDKLHKTLIETFKQLPYKILWKYEDDTMKDKPKNVMITKWAPQQDILRHKNIKLFITQGGLQSLEEALYNHVPLVVLPFVADQRSNADKAKHKGLGLVLDWQTLTVDEFKSAIFEVIKTPKYKETIKRFARLIQDEPMKPVDKAVWWTEYVLRHKGGKHLKGPQIPAYQYFYLDVLAVLGVAVVILVVIVYFLLKFTWRCLCYLVHYCGFRGARTSITSARDKNEKCKQN